MCISYMLLIIHVYVMYKSYTLHVTNNMYIICDLHVYVIYIMHVIAHHVL